MPYKSTDYGCFNSLVKIGRKHRAVSFLENYRKNNQMKPKYNSGFKTCTMKNYSLLIGLTGLLTLLSWTSKADVDITFLPGDLNNVKQIAGSEGKLYLVDFVAKWCMPCKWMDETTFADPQVADYLRENYISTKVDIDNFDGFNYKNEYNITVLPSILIFNSKGEMVGRYEESMPPSKMLKVLAAHNHPENRVITRTYTSEPEIATPEPIIEVAEAPTYEINPASFPEENIVDEVTVETTDYPIELETPSYTDNVEKNEVEYNTPDVNLFRMSAVPQVKSGYSVQVGVFANYGNILKESAKFKTLYNQEAIVEVSKLNDKEVFKLLIGDFSSIEEAHSLRRLMESQGVQGITKDLSKI